MKTIYFITGNNSKFKEAEKIIKNKNIKLVQKNLDLIEIQSLNTGKVVKDKAKQAFEKLKKPIIVDDTGIYFEEYKNFPGTYTGHLFKSLGFSGLLRLLKTKNKNAYFKTFICYKDKYIEKVFSGVWKGKITNKISKKFNPDWQYNNIFIPNNCNKVLSEISLEKRAKLSHRKKAMDKLNNFLKGGRAFSH